MLFFQKVLWKSKWAQQCYGFWVIQVIPSSFLSSRKDENPSFKSPNLSLHSWFFLYSFQSKKSYWSEEDEEKLARVYHQVKEMEKDDSVDKLDSITFFFTESGKSRRQVAKKLKEMGLIQVWMD